MVKGELKPIENEDKRQVSFSKRRQSLFKKAYELSILCGAKVGSVVFSPTGRPFSFGHPSIDEVANRFLNSAAPDVPTSGGASQGSIGAEVTDAINIRNMEHSEMQISLESQKEKTKILQEATDEEMGEPMMRWLNANILDLGLEELQELQKWLDTIYGVVKKKEDHIPAEPSQTEESVPQPAMDIASTSQHQFGDVNCAFVSGSGSVDGGNGSGNFPNN